MALSNSILAYNDCKEFLERAVDDEKGARIPFRTEKEAEYWRMRCNQFRSLDRQQNRMIFELGHKMHGHSEYDGLTMIIKHSQDGYAWVYAEKRTLEPGLIENLSEVEDVPRLSRDEMRMLEDHSNGNETSS